MKIQALVSAGITAILLGALVAPVVFIPVESASAATSFSVRREATRRRAILARKATLARQVTLARRPAPVVNVAPAPVAPTAPTAPAADRWIGTYVTGSAENMTTLTALEGQVGQKFSVRNYFQNTSQGFTEVQASAISAHGAIPMATLEFQNPALGTGMSGGTYSQIAAGSMDAYLQRYARNAAAYGKPVWLRPFHEMNGDWYPWSGTAAGNTSADFIAAWRHVHAVFAAEGATNVKFVWSPNADSVPNTTANAIAKYWPGDAYVDYIGLDGYNFGTTAATWRSFSSVFGAAYAAVAGLSSKPIFIAETGTGTVGGDKAAWIASMFKTIPTSFSRIVGVTWFNANKERDWRIESSTASLNSFKTNSAAF